MKLTNAELTARDAHVEALNAAHSAMVEAIRAYNAALSAAATFAETIATERREWEGFEAEEIDEPENAADGIEALTTDSSDM